MSRSGSSSGSGCSRVLLIGGGCLLVLIVGLVGLVAAGGLLWERSSDAGADFASEWVREQLGTDIANRAEEAEQVTDSLPQPREFTSEDAYLDFLRSHNQEAVTAVEELGRLLSRPHLNDDEWADNVARQVAIIRGIEARAREATPPEHLQEAHGHWVTGMEEFRRASDSTATAVDDLDPGALTDALDAMHNAARSYGSMAETLREQGIVEDLERIDRLTPTEDP